MVRVATSRGLRACSPDCVQFGNRALFGGSAPKPPEFIAFGQNGRFGSATIEALERRIGLRRNATRAPTQAPEWRGLASIVAAPDLIVNRINLFWGLNWQAIPRALTAQTLAGYYASYGEPTLRPDVVVGCVDTRAARAIIAKSTTGLSAVGYWLDLGNSHSSGQFVLGEPPNARNKRSPTRLRTVAELYPEIVDPALDDDNEPSCSAIEALERQECFVNTVLAQQALALLARLIRYGQISHHGGFVDVATSRSVPIAVDPLLWRRVRKRGQRNDRRSFCAA
jgi:PRTRC genetic system ThiF family protein